ncbi:MAG: HAD family hydrolase [Actinomycetota bacterium]
MIKLIATDVDGTLMDDSYKVSEFNIRALSDCRTKGIGIVLATGKLIYSLMPIINRLGLDLPQITGSGATIIDSKMNVYAACTIKPSVYLKLIRSIKAGGCAPLVSVSGNTMHYEQFLPVVAYIGKTGEKIFPADNLEHDKFKNNAIAISVLYKQGGLDREISSMFGPRQIRITKPWKRFMHILAPEISKGDALLKIMQKAGLKKEEVAAFGDNINDISMFEVAGLKIAVENAHKDLARLADVITRKNSDSGVGKAIYEYILNSTG